MFGQFRQIAITRVTGWFFWILWLQILCSSFTKLNHFLITSTLFPLIDAWSLQVFTEERRVTTAKFYKKCTFSPSPIYCTFKIPMKSEFNTNSLNCNTEKGWFWLCVTPLPSQLQAPPTHKAISTICCNQ